MNDPVNGSLEEPIRYEVSFTETAEIEVEAAVLYLTGRFSPERATECYLGLREATDGLTVFPNRFPYVPDRSRYDGTVRYRLYGRGSAAYRITYRVIEPFSPDEVGTVRVLHVLHALRYDPAIDPPRQDAS